jgi:hypothetical protein
LVKLPDMPNKQFLGLSYAFFIVIELIKYQKDRCDKRQGEQIWIGIYEAALAYQNSE